MVHQFISPLRSFGCSFLRVRTIFQTQIDNFGSPPDDRYHLLCTDRVKG